MVHSESCGLTKTSSDNDKKMQLQLNVIMRKERALNDLVNNFNYFLYFNGNWLTTSCHRKQQCPLFSNCLFTSFPLLSICPDIFSTSILVEFRSLQNTTQTRFENLKKTFQEKREQNLLVKLFVPLFLNYYKKMAELLSKLDRLLNNKQMVEMNENK